MRSRLAPKPRDDLTQCANCGRNFAEDRIEKHQEICIKTSKKKRKTFDMTKKRLEGTDAENFALRKGGRRRVSSTILALIIKGLSEFQSKLGQKKVKSCSENHKIDLY